MRFIFLSDFPTSYELIGVTLTTAGLFYRHPIVCRGEKYGGYSEIRHGKDFHGALIRANFPEAIFFTISVL